MEHLELYRWIAILFGVLFVAQWCFCVFGIEHFDNASMDTTFEKESSGVNTFFSYLSSRNVISFGISFGIAAFFIERECGLGAFRTPFLSVFIGVLFVFINDLIFNAFMRLQRLTDISEYDLLGARGVVLTGVPANRAGRGKVTVNVNGNIAEYFALTDGEPIESSNSVIVLEVLENWDLVVRVPNIQ